MLQKTAKEMKKKKKSKASTQKKNPNTWNYFLRDTNITHSEYCVIKTWRSPHRQCPAASSQHPTLVEVDAKYIKACWLKHAYKSRASTPYNAACNVSLVVTGDCTPAFRYSISKSFVSYGPWYGEYCNIKEPFDPTQRMRFCNVVEFEARFYAMSLQGSVVVIDKQDVDSDRFVITRVGRGDRAVPSKACKQFREYLVKSSRGEIFVVFLISRNSISVVDDVEVLRLDTEKLSWVQVGNIGERAFFLHEAEGCVKFESCERGFKKNCIYFTHPFIDDWMVFDMETRLILPHLDVEIETQ